MPAKHKTGFTLAELLIALAILGVIATFTLPKILQSANDNQRNALVKEFYAAISDLAYATHLQAKYPSNKITYLQQNINYVKWCNNLMTNGCRSVAMAYPNWGTYPGVLLSNGMTVSIENPGYPDSQGVIFIMDTNGDGPPNLPSIDEFTIKGNFDGTTIAANSDFPTILPGQVKSSLVDQSTWDKIFSR